LPASQDKTKAITLLWASILLSAFLLIEVVWVRVALLIVACAVTFYLLYLPTINFEDNERDL
jgi:uncharacterized membrane protein YbaN (DUF454 family)